MPRSKVKWFGRVDDIRYRTVQRNNRSAPRVMVRVVADDSSTHGRVVDVILTAEEALSWAERLTSAAKTATSNAKFLN